MSYDIKEKGGPQTVLIITLDKTTTVTIFQ